MKHTLKVSLLLLALLSFSFAQNLDYGDDAPAGTQEPQDSQEHPDGVPQNGEYDEAMAQIQRIMQWGCYFLTKNVMYERIEELNNLFSLSPDAEHKDRLYKKIASDLMYECATTANPDDMYELVTSYGKEGFDFSKFNKFHTFSVDKYTNVDIPPVTEGQDPAYELFNYIDNMISEQAQRMQEQSGDYEDQRGQYRGEPTIAGYPVSDIASLMKVVFVTSSVTLVGLLLLNAYQKRKAPAVVPGTEIKGKGKKDLKNKEGKAGEAKSGESKGESKESGEKEEKSDKKDKKKAKAE